MRHTNKQEPYVQELWDEHYIACKISSSSFSFKNPEVTSSWSCTLSNAYIIYRVPSFSVSEVDQKTVCSGF